MINKVILVGNLTRDAETVASSGRPMTRMRIATNTAWKDATGNRQESSEFHSVVTFGKLAETCALYCLRGHRVYLEGRLRTREFAGTDGLRRTSTEIVAEEVKFLQPRSDRGAAGDVPDEARVDDPAELHVVAEAVRV